MSLKKFIIYFVISDILLFIALPSIITDAPYTATTLFIAVQPLFFMLVYMYHVAFEGYEKYGYLKDPRKFSHAWRDAGKYASQLTFWQHMMRVIAVMAYFALGVWFMAFWISIN